MKYLEDDALTKWTLAMTDVILGDGRRVMNGRLEAFTMKRAGTDKKVAHALGEQLVAKREQEEEEMFLMQQQEQQTKRRSQSLGDAEEECTNPTTSSKRRKIRAQSFDVASNNNTSPNPSPSSLEDNDLTRRLMTDLILTLNASFPDYDFGNVVRPWHFQKCSLSNVMKNINTRLTEWAGAQEKTLLDLWNAMDNVMSLQNVQIYSYVPPQVNDEDPMSFLTQTLGSGETSNIHPPTNPTTSETNSYAMTSTNTATRIPDATNGHHHSFEGNDNNNHTTMTTTPPLWSFNYFFVNKQWKRILLFTCVETMMTMTPLPAEEDDENNEMVGRYRIVEGDFDLDPASADVAGGIPVVAAVI